MKPSEVDSIHKRGRALEEAFFAERDQHLLDMMRRRLTAEEAKNVLVAATGVKDEVAIRELAGLDAFQFLAVLGIFPLIEVAWCDGTVSEKERIAILDGAADMGISVDSPSYQLLNRWLEARPADNAHSLWESYVKSLCATLKPETKAKLKEGVLGRAKKVAAAAGGILGLGDKISSAERDCLERLAAAFD